MDSSGRHQVAREEATSARRRRERRHRAWLRHERLSIAMALAEQLHHSSQWVERNEALRRQTTRAGEEVEQETYQAPRGKNTPPPAAGPQYFSFDDDDGPAEGRRPDALREPASHGSSQCNVRHCGSGYELVLDATVPQLGVEVDVPGKVEMHSLGVCGP